MISRTSYNSLKKGELAKGCLSCVRGCKAVIFVTGVCSRNCYFCPTSDQKNKNDVTYANERPLANTDEKTMIKGIIEEAERQKARGAGLTGGDPLSRLERTVTIIKALKQEFGKAFHCHLYTILNLVDEKKLKMLYDAGLDEIRFHPDLDDQKLWERIGIAQKFDWDIGVEIPAIPG
ncbi:MAG: radical SAM protein, partial [Nanoarchaeota archaeon]